MRQLYKDGTDPEERKRIEKIEFLDEWEEWNIIQSHYLVSLSFNFDGSEIRELVRLKIN